MTIDDSYDSGNSFQAVAMGSEVRGF